MCIEHQFHALSPEIVRQATVELGRRINTSSLIARAAREFDRQAERMACDMIEIAAEKDSACDRDLLTRGWSALDIVTYARAAATIARRRLPEAVS